jgi:F-type H+-transporting ATPase subunit a
MNAFAALLASTEAAVEATAHAAEEAAHGAAEAAGHAAPHAAEGGHAEGPSEIMMHHVVDSPFDFWGLLPVPFPSKHLFVFVVAALIVLFVVRLAIRSYKKGGVPTGIGAAVEGLVLFIRDDLAEKNIGHDGHKFTSLLCSFFFFILIAALLGLMPFSATSTGNLAVTLALAVVSFGAQQWAGISKYGVGGHFHNLVPPGLPMWLLPIMIPVEILGMFSKPFALMIRLFANMLAGHMVITALLLLIPLMADVSVALGLFMVPVSLGLSLFIMLLELLVAFIQAYIFTLLTAIFIGMYAHPAH